VEDDNNVKELVEVKVNLLTILSKVIVKGKLSDCK
jgi:hypothetical protein